MNRGDKVVYVGEEWGAWYHGRPATVAGFKQGREERLVELFSPPADNQFFPLDWVRSEEA